MKCEPFTPRVRAIKISRMQPARREKTWLEGSPKSVTSVTCDIRGMKTGESEYDGKALRLKTAFTYKEGDEAKTLCENLMSEQKLTSTFSGEARSSLDEFCRRNRKKDFGVALVHDLSPSGAGTQPRGQESFRQPIRQIFRLYNTRGFVTEEFAFDPLLNLETRTVYAYDKANNLTETTVLDFDDRQLSRETLTRDKKTASRTRSVYGESNELRKKTVYEDREDGTLRRETRSSYDAGEQVITRSEIYCNAKGRYEKELLYDGDAPEPGHELTYAYTVDAKGNWTQERRNRTILYNGNRIPDTQAAPEITNRELQYY
ncbi:MAG: hypothetical protein A2285_03500 [Elusimicrobia bacterium RIFOXYA12_FULL_57_11]|nr:MAG: hypothetical protein A2285_03500 [Elusimicrobia bacterium RIFOXYA12_FULL_57_11]